MCMRVCVCVCVCVSNAYVTHKDTHTMAHKASMARKSARRRT